MCPMPLRPRLQHQLWPIWVVSITILCQKPPISYNLSNPKFVPKLRASSVNAICSVWLQHVAREVVAGGGFGKLAFDIAWVDNHRFAAVVASVVRKVFEQFFHNRV